ncbi:hypothetical protein GGE46_004901 [Rhizobium etli]|uniref:Uncharacterized protein n=1 Tax=Rhizobium etli TaxID=29449 RepID=A0A7W6YBJ8_RHIET|nr:hypothetical protein [Rhizobium etli]MBB4538117.1 hypothetical protein [Rhizobium etli]
MMLDQQPIGTLAALAIATHAHKHEASVQALAVKRELEIALEKGLLGARSSLRLPITAIPQHDCAAAILAFRNRTFEIAIIEWMVLDLDRQALVVWIERWTLGDGPALEHAVELEPQVVVQTCRIVLLNDEAAAVALLDAPFTAGLSGLLKIAF